MIITLPRSAWRYGVQIVILIAIAALTSALIIAYLEEQITGPNREEIIWHVNISVWSLTMGFMFLSGALGLWAIRSTVGIEGRRRIGRFVDTMDYLSDGLFVCGKSGGIIGSNPSARQLAHDLNTESQTDIFGLFPALPRSEAELLLSSRHPHETCADCGYPHGLRTLRFRSQPSEDVVLLLVSDVTETRFNEIRQKHIAQLQLLGRIAGGLADDFNDILCAISGHAALLKRDDLAQAVRNNLLDIIGKETGRGARLSRMLLDLSRSGTSGSPSSNLADNVKEAGALLRVALPSGWTVRISVRGEYPTVPLAPAQIEQLVVNLGLLAADSLANPGMIMITLDSPGHEHLLEAGNRFAAVILISAHASGTLYDDAGIMEDAVPLCHETGVVMSVVRSMVEEAGGRADILASPGGLSVYRVCLPHLDTAEPENTPVPSSG